MLPEILHAKSKEVPGTAWTFTFSVSIGASTAIHAPSAENFDSDAWVKQTVSYSKDEVDQVLWVC
jgi:hypothetical protein